MARNLDAFSPDYETARGKFRRAADEAGAGLECHDHPAAGPGGVALSSEVATLGAADADRLLLVNAGTHGVEGFAGSAVETAFLAARHRIPDGVRVVLIHAINPHGFAWLRRVTEDNVDLNRNFIDHAAARPVNPEYDALHPLICPERWDEESRARSSRAMEDYAARHGLSALQSVITRGQYDHADGIFYGGGAPTWSNRTFRTIVERHLSGARLVAFIDVHTGLGAYGAAEMISGAAGDTPAGRRLRAWYGEALTSPSAGTSSSAPLRGVIASAVRAAAASGGGELVSATLEFGTYPVRAVLEALQADNWVHAHGDPDSPRGRAIKARTRKALFPDEDDWKKSVLVRGGRILARALAGLKTDRGPAPGPGTREPRR